MKVKAFELSEPVPALRDPLVIANLVPWLDAGSAGTLVLSRLGEHFRGKELAHLDTPGRFFDFTRYRPVVRYNGQERVVELPNTRLSHAKLQTGGDVLLFHVWEPHMFADEYMDSILRLFRALGVRRHCRIGAWWDAVPHTRLLPVTYSIGGQSVDPRTRRPLPRRGSYSGPTSIMNQVTDRLEAMGIENMSVTLRLPYYARLEEDYTGVARLLEILSEVFGFPPSLADTIAADAAEGRDQYRKISQEVAASPEVQSLVQRLEADYDVESTSSQESDEPPTLSPEVERFLRELDERLGSS